MDANEEYALDSSESAPADSDSWDTDGKFATSPEETEWGQPDSSVLAEEVGDDPNDVNLPFHEHPRFQKLIQERNEYREQAKMAQAYAPILEQFSEAGLTDAEAIQDAYEHQLAYRQEEESLQGIQQEIEDQLHDYRDELEEEGVTDPEIVNRLLVGRQAELVNEATEQIIQVHQYADAMSAARDALWDMPEAYQDPVLEIISSFDAENVPIVAQCLQQLTQAIREETIVAYEADRARRGGSFAPVNGSGYTPALTPEYKSGSGSLGQHLRNMIGMGRV